MAPAAADVAVSSMVTVSEVPTKQTKPVYTASTLAERPDLQQAVVELCEKLTCPRPGVNSEFGWPTFLYKGSGGQAFFEVVFGFPQYQTLVVANKEGGGESLVAVGYAAPCVWGGEGLEDLPPGWDYVIATAKRMLTDPANAPSPTAMSALAVEVTPQHQGRGLSQMVLGHMKVIAGRQGAKGLLAPIRPILKPQYPLVDMDAYIAWRLPDSKKPGEEMVFDPWLRTHIRLGARIMRVARGSCTISGSVSDWESWTGLRFLSTGPYTVPGGLNVLEVDRDAGVAVYREDNVWVAHVLA